MGEIAPVVGHIGFELLYKNFLSLVPEYQPALISRERQLQPQRIPIRGIFKWPTIKFQRQGAFISSIDDDRIRLYLSVLFFIPHRMRIDHLRLLCAGRYSYQQNASQ